MALCSVRQTREQLQTELIGCQARIADLERSLAEKGQVNKAAGGQKTPLTPVTLASLLVFLTAMLVCWRYTERMWLQIM